MTSTGISELSKRIEQVIQEHLEASQRAATDAMARAFGAARGGPGRARLTPRPGGGSRRRPAAEMAALGQQFYQAVCERPGETMVVLAADIGSSPRELNRPVTILKRLGQVRSVGQRNLTRYFPLAAKS